MAFALSACAMGPDFLRPAASSQKAYLSNHADQTGTVAAVGKAQHFNPKQVLHSDWWHLFKSAEINQWVDQALAQNPSLEAAKASLRRSQDAVRAGMGVFYPQVNIGLSASHQRNAPLVNGSSLSSAEFNVSTLSGLVSYTLDLFGLERRTVEGLEASAEAQLNITRAAYLSVEANMVNAAIAKAAYHEVIQLELGLIHDLKLQKQLLENQADSGMTSYAGILSVSESLENSRATLAQSEQKKDQIDHFISSLLGEDTSQASLPNSTLRTMILPSDLPLSLPSELVRQRPDILIAEAQMHSNSAAVGVATAMLWPSISLTAGGGFTRPQLNALNGPSQRFWSIGPSINFPLFTGGTLSYQKEAAIQQLVSSEAQYRQTVLNAFANVSDALTALQHDASYLAALDQVKADAELTFTLAELNNAAGLTDYGAVLNARILYQQAQINYWQAYAQRLQDTVSLFVSLGGGWWNPPDLHS